MGIAPVHGHYFQSKLLATVDVDRPIWDQYVLKSLGRYKEWNSFNGKDKEERISKAVEIYADIEKWYADFLNSKDGKECVKKFDTILPDYAGKVSDVKKIDFFYGSSRRINRRRNVVDPCRDGSESR